VIKPFLMTSHIIFSHFSIRYVIQKGLEDKFTTLYLYPAIYLIKLININIIKVRYYKRSCRQSFYNQNTSRNTRIVNKSIFMIIFFHFGIDAKRSCVRLLLLVKSTETHLPPPAPNRQQVSACFYRFFLWGSFDMSPLSRVICHVRTFLI
jgi:predicted ATP-dependent endonuclease of OLD family